MKLSELDVIKKENLHNERQFEALGILASQAKSTMCTFLDNEKYINDLKENFTMVITNKEIYEKIKDRDCGFYIAENPRIEFFNIHNILCENSNYVRNTFITNIGYNCNISKMAGTAE